MRQDIHQPASMLAMPDQTEPGGASAAIFAQPSWVPSELTATGDATGEIYSELEDSSHISCDNTFEPIGNVDVDVDVGGLSATSECLFIELAEKKSKKRAGNVENLQKLRDELSAFVKLGIREDLTTLYFALQRQLPNCSADHLLRLRLTGFCHKNLASSKTMFQFYISPRHYGPEYAWVHCTADFARSSLISTSQPTLCHHLTSAEQGRKSLLISINRQKQIRLRRDSNMMSPSESRQPESFQTALKYGKPTRTLPMHSLSQLVELPCIAMTDPGNAIEADNRDRLCFNMALSAFFLFRTPWKQVRWCGRRNFDANIHFCRDPATRIIHHQTEALLSCPIGPDSSHPEYDKDLNGDLNLLELAKLLVEVRFWETPDFLRDPTGLLSNEDIRKNLDYFINNHRELGRREGDFLYAVKACIRPEGQKFEPTDDGFFQYFSAEILRPLASYAGINCLAVEDLKEYSVSVIEEQRKPLEKLPHKRVKGPGSSTAEDFMHRMRMFTNAYVKVRRNPLRTPLSKNRDRKIRIAIIDSGVCSRDEYIRENRRNGRIKGQRNFSDSNVDDLEDFHGHGTTVAKILLEVAPETEVYIAKVTSSQSLSDQELGNIYEVWQVDMINISIAIEEKSVDIDRALARALIPASTIIFAAAHRNVGQHEGPTWPGTRSGVIAIHSTDGEGRPQGHASVGMDKYFATLGCDIATTESFCTPGTFCRPKRTEVYATGVSYATPIAAGIAANVLEIIRHDAAPDYDDVRRWFYNGQYVKRLFEAMSQEDNRCRFVQPWKFWQEVIKGETKQGDVELRRGDGGNVMKVLQMLVSK
ncbi:subtilisin, putative [Cordyceps militaris CM01]|uniref:Subtilisin, putative n=1 Tax=Cordyceps militaris (strain CM01) TaxID=983644 RepID=G3JJ78_CORMM|nr:subtilisin, putative [Cordyceps militaris CM01]EGX92020.1 subtilisin, putative [Cordyceps militaris CM01]